VFVLLPYADTDSGVRQLSLRAIMAAIDNGDIKVEGGSKEDVQQFFNYFDPPPDPSKINLIVR